MHDNNVWVKKVLKNEDISLIGFAVQISAQRTANFA